MYVLLYKLENLARGSRGRVEKGRHTVSAVCSRCWWVPQGEKEREREAMCAMTASCKAPVLTSELWAADSTNAQVIFAGRIEVPAENKCKSVEVRIYFRSPTEMFVDQRWLFRVVKKCSAKSVDDLLFFAHVHFVCAAGLG